MSDKRREPRFGARIVARIVRRGETLDLLTNDVSFKGAFLRTDSAPATRQLVKVELVLPAGGTVSGHAMVVHVTPPGDGNRVPGVGLQFWGPLQNGKAWESFIHELRVKEKLGVPAARATDKVRRASERFRLQFDVELGGKTLVTRDVSMNGMAVRCTKPYLPIGAHVDMVVKAPKRPPTKLEVVVRRHIEEPDFHGIGVEFADSSPDSRGRIVALVRQHAPDEDAVYIDPDDPGLH